MYHIGEALVRWIAPILSFTAEEIWEHLPGERAPSVLLQQWYRGLQNLAPNAAMGRNFWQQSWSCARQSTRRWRHSARLEVLRGSLDAAVTLYCASRPAETLRSLGDELRFVLITSKATLMPLAAAGADAVSTDLPELRLLITVATDEKCERCWHRSPEVGLNTLHATLCGRCIENVDGTGERRQFDVMVSTLCRGSRLALIVVLLDQYTKGLATNALDYGQPVRVFWWLEI